MKKGRVVVSLILRILLLASIVYALLNMTLGFLPSSGGPKADLLDAVKFFTVDSNALMAVVTLLLIIVDIVALAKGKFGKSAKFWRALELIAVTSVGITGITVIAYLIPVSGVAFADAYDVGYNLILHATTPVAAILIYIIDNEPRLKAWKYAFLGLITPVIYGGVMGALVNTNQLKDPYGFLAIDNSKVYMTVIYIAAFLVGSYLLALVLTLLHNLGASRPDAAPALAEPVKEEEKPVEEEKPAEAAPIVEEVQPAGRSHRLR